VGICPHYTDKRTDNIACLYTTIVDGDTLNPLLLNMISAFPRHTSDRKQTSKQINEAQKKKKKKKKKRKV
jgi:hypothetical protein